MSDDKKIIETAKLTSKGQVTVPKSVREFFAAEAGDILSFVLENNQVKVKKIEPLDLEYYKSLSSSLSQEWDSKEDSEAYDDL